MVEICKSSLWILVQSGDRTVFLVLILPFKVRRNGGRHPTIPREYRLKEDVSWYGLLVIFELHGAGGILLAPCISHSNKSQASLLDRDRSILRDMISWQFITGLVAF